MSIYTFDDDKLKVLQILATRIADKENYDKIINSLDFYPVKTKPKKCLAFPKTIIISSLVYKSPAITYLKQIVAMAGILLKKQREYALFIKNYFMP